MRLNGKNGFAVILIVLGAMIVLGKLGIISGLFGLLIPAAMVALGYIGIKNGSRFFGWALAIIGLLVLLGKLSGILWIVFAAGFIVYGVSMLKKSSRA
ncbi:LiaF transmembrane domain-containing protein [Paenibacillus gansuensis]|uniref:LiaF transmembrane domain-containing protein n=1 Tax=Paenibacillus gansuensis TaxID=306542 RepID=A0ABW5PIP2_9BACL